MHDRRPPALLLSDGSFCGHRETTQGVHADESIHTYAETGIKDQLRIYLFENPVNCIELYEFLLETRHKASAIARHSHANGNAFHAQ